MWVQFYLWVADKLKQGDAVHDAGIAADRMLAEYDKRFPVIQDADQPRAVDAQPDLCSLTTCTFPRRHNSLYCIKHGR